MKFGIVSDLHLEFRNPEEKREILRMLDDLSQQVDVVINAGDIHPNRIAREMVGTLFEPGTYVENLGNHDFYGSHIEDYNKVYACGDLKVLALTLWTDFDQGNAFCMGNFSKYMMDGIKIEPFGTKLAETIYDIHLHHLKLIKEEKPDIVVSHHCPSFKSVHEAYRFDYKMNSYFYSDLDNFILENPNIKLWVHGHTHMPFDYKIGETRVVCNPLGYPFERQLSEYKPLLVEIP